MLRSQPFARWSKLSKQQQTHTTDLQWITFSECCMYVVLSGDQNVRLVLSRCNRWCRFILRKWATNWIFSLGPDEIHFSVLFAPNSLLFHFTFIEFCFMTSSTLILPFQSVQHSVFLALHTGRRPQVALHASIQFQLKLCCDRICKKMHINWCIKSFWKLLSSVLWGK